MPENQPAIERLSLPTQAKLRSTQILTSFPQIVSELLQNSLDANATRIEIGLDCKEWMCWVRDNGHGISKEGLELFGQGEEGGRYNTSKTYKLRSSNSLSTFGFRGEALASAAGVSCLEICSRTSKSRNTWSVILKGDQILYRGPAVRWKRESPGTTVCIRDAFYNLPVRRLSHTAPPRTWDLVRQEIERYSLMFPPVSFTLEDTSHAGGSSQQNHIIRIPKNTSTLGTFRQLYGHALIQHIEEIGSAEGTTKIEGFISLTGAPSKAYQFLYINRHPITGSDLGHVIDSQFAPSSFGKNALDEEGERNIPRSTIRRSPRKAEKKPVYVLNISIPPEEVDNCLDPSKSVIQLRNKSNILAFLSSTIQSFLKKHGFLTQNECAFGRSTGSPSPRKRKKLNLEDSGYAEADSISEISGLSLQHDKRASPISLIGDLHTSAEGISEEIAWTDPFTGQRFLVDSRTGNSRHRSGSHLQVENEMSTIVDTDKQEGRRTLRQQKTSNSAKPDSNPGQSSVPAWLEQALESNQAYAMTEHKVPSMKAPPVSYHIPQSYNTAPGDKHESHTPQNPTPFRVGDYDSIYATSSHRFTRDDIRHAEIINQVDRKFIACRIAKRSGTMSPQEIHDPKLPSNTILVLIDQHAADERVRVERFLKELFLGFLYSQDRTEGNQTGGVRIRELNPPHPVLLTLHEAHTIKRSQDVREMLRKWGVQFAELSKVKPDLDGTSDPGSSAGYLQLLVSSIPEVVSDKLLQGDELRDFIKGFLGQIQSGELFPDSGLGLSSEEDQDESLWFKAVRWCPRGLLDLINSKACRGAIMFNDSLSLTQCEKLVRQLSETVFPFQCAHGRPSLVPLVEAGQVQSNPLKRKRRRNDWTRLETMTDA
ncbi:hypothetical protein GALMADRAFT_236565 [Galerina marginata CBS 339.88]|uniref:MutL C-terminal dimerisation domain-containing protein n=1 Tax=Galerina marginata (strain CBS 339.88) TaxID=685588 RepID=A0A067TNX7_GALM3|nr:hypothetical protein GALMADRAFT_236565 [Galerina marginata CBS 339.88]